MNDRLIRISEEIGQGTGFVDVGTDHGYLPLYMIEQGYKGNVFASDINSDPLNKAIVNAEEAGVNDKIQFMLCDGLSDNVRDKIDTIVIAGMGGDTICGILDRAVWCFDNRYKLILQPMTKSEILRYWLSYNDFEITREILLEDNGSIYQIICAVFGKRTELSDAELFVGPYNKVRSNELFSKRLDKIIKRFEKLLRGLECSKDSADKQRIPLNTGIYNQLCAMRDGSFQGGQNNDNSK